MVYAYRRMRADIAAIGIKASVRITVRQLEALVRLSEALARIYLENSVKSRHVRVAVKLLLGSIQSLESEDLILEDDEKDKYFSKALYKNMTTQHTSKPLLRLSQPELIKKTLISGTKYKMISQLLMTRLRQENQIKLIRKQSHDSKANSCKGNGLKQSILVDWIIQHTISLKLLRHEDAANETLLIPKIIHKLIKQKKIVAFIPKMNRRDEESDDQYFYP